MYIFSALIFSTAVQVIHSKNPIHSVFYIKILCIHICAILLILSRIEFLALILIIIYVGAIAILFLFVVMMLNIPISYNSKKQINFYLPLLIFMLFIFLFEIFFLWKSEFFINYPTKFKIDNFDGEYGLFFFPINTKRVETAIDLDFGQVLHDNQFRLLYLDSLLDIDCLGQLLYSFYGSLFLLIGIILLIALIGTVILTLQEKEFNHSQYLYKQISRNPVQAVFLFYLI